VPTTSIMFVILSSALVLGGVTVVAVLQHVAANIPELEP
jgi:hypothetical protein